MNVFKIIFRDLFMMNRAENISYIIRIVRGLRGSIIFQANCEIKCNFLHFFTIFFYKKRKNQRKKQKFIESIKKLNVTSTKHLEKQKIIIAKNNAFWISEIRLAW